MTDTAAHDAFQQAVGKWADRQFPHGTISTILAHLRDEAEELIAAIDQQPQNLHRVAEELADVQLVGLHLAHRNGCSQHMFEQEKHAINQGRTWGQPDERGVVRHVEANGG